MKRRQVIELGSGCVLASVAGCTALDRFDRADAGEVVVDETVPEGSHPPVFEFEAAEGQALSASVEWDRDQYDEAVGVIVARDRAFDAIVRDESLEYSDDDVLVARATPQRSFHGPVRTTGVYNAAVTMAIASDRLPATLPVDVGFTIGISDDPEIRPV